MKKLFILTLLMLLAACGRQAGIPEIEQAGESEKIWQAYLDYDSRLDHPYKIKMSLRFGKPGDTRRITGLLWGNTPALARLDIMAGIGSVIAQISSSPESLRLYMPLEKKEYYYDGSGNPLLKAGLPIPFDIRQLVSLLNGNYTAVFGKKTSGKPRADSSGLEVELVGKLRGQLRLNELGQPVDWRQGGGGWQAKFGYDNSLKPVRVELTYPEGPACLLLIKEREEPTQAYPPAQLKLAIPPDIPRLPLDRYEPEPATS